MTGGILQIVARSAEDIYLTKDPTITLFKTVYRRHTNFSHEEKKLQFASKVGFDKKCICPIKKLGDLLHNMYLVVTLPKVDIFLDTLTSIEAAVILKTHDITWVGDDSVITASDLTEIQGLINSKTTELTSQRNLIDDPDSTADIVNAITSVQSQISDNAITHEVFFENLMTAIIELDDNKIIYNFLKAKKDDSSNLVLSTFLSLRRTLYNIFRNLVVDVANNTTTLQDENLIFLNMIDRENFTIRKVATGKDSKYFFNIRLDDMFSQTTTLENFSAKYGAGSTWLNVKDIVVEKFVSNNILSIGEGVIFNDVFFGNPSGTTNTLVVTINGIDTILAETGRVNIELSLLGYMPTVDYTQLDTYKLFYTYFEASSHIINNTYDTTILKDKVVNHMLYNIGKNLQLFIKIYNSLLEPYRFIFYKRFSYDTVTQVYDKKELFVNVSTLQTTKFSDNFTDNFNLEALTNEPSDLNHVYYTYISNSMTPFHISNRLSFRENVYEGYFEQTSLWTGVRFESETYESSGQTYQELLSINSSKYTTFQNVSVMTLIPHKIVRSIYDALLSYTEYVDTNGIVNT